MKKTPMVATILAAGLIGCADRSRDLTSPAPPPPRPTLSVAIAGPGRIENGGLFSWQGVPSGGTGSYQYRWEATSRLGNQLATGAQQTFSLLVTGGEGDLELSLTVMSHDESRTAHLEVLNCGHTCRF